MGGECLGESIKGISGIIGIEVMRCAARVCDRSTDPSSGTVQQPNDVDQQKSSYTGPPPTLGPIMTCVGAHARY